MQLAKILIFGLALAERSDSEDWPYYSQK